jgi:hypothetical protein
MGKARAKQLDLMKSEVDCELGDRVICIQLHGDAVSEKRKNQGVHFRKLPFGFSKLNFY